MENLKQPKFSRRQLFQNSLTAMSIFALNGSEMEWRSFISTKPSSDNHLYGLLYSNSPIKIASDEYIYPSEPMDVLGYGENYSFKVRLSNNRIVYIPIQNVNIQGIPSWSVKRNSSIGIRNDESNIMDLVPKIGADWIRISVGKGDIQNQGLLSETITRAKETKMKILINYNPQDYTSPIIIWNQLNEILSYFKNYEDIVFELGNEPDNDTVPFWIDRNMYTFSQFIYTASKQINELRPNAKIVMGAFIDVRNINIVLQYLKWLGIDTSKFILAIHAYNYTQSVVEQSVYLQKLASKDRLWFTELGTDNPNKSVITKLIKSALRYTDRVFIHELPNTKGYGYVDSRTENPIIDYYLIQYYTQFGR